MICSGGTSGFEQILDEGEEQRRAQRCLEKSASQAHRAHAPLFKTFRPASKSIGNETDECATLDRDKRRTNV